MKRKNKPADDRRRNDALNKSQGTREEKKLPGDYNPKEDIMNRKNTQRVSLNVENFSRQVGVENFNKPDEPVITNRNDVQEQPEISSVDEQAEWPAAREMERPVPKDINLENDNIQPTEQNESDVTPEDMQALGPKDLSLDMGEDENVLKNRVWPVDMAGQDLDVPGSENSGDVSGEAIGPEDEENDFYSLGGDEKEDNLEGK